MNDNKVRLKIGNVCALVSKLNRFRMILKYLLKFHTAKKRYEWTSSKIILALFRVFVKEEKSQGNQDGYVGDKEQNSLTTTRLEKKDKQQKQTKTKITQTQ